ncbi:hypothetical protein [Streptomyces shenzhenensis]|uniref:hypothetical protein n=1 Tax=Streptomyces shenzhenensis TaxID=943815 RepID=UPI001604CA1E|nr:hypothetical protein [Streptomyces shenzhenensis]
MRLDGLNEALKNAARLPGRGRRRFGWWQVLTQGLCIAAVTAFVAALLLYADGDL